MKENRGKFIAIYGANNLGKSTQRDRLTVALRGRGLNVNPLKYPIYSIPSGQKLNETLRGETRMSPVNLQALFAQNRRDYQPTIEWLLENNHWCVAEDYTVTGKAWGMAKGVNLKYLEEVNSDLLDEDFAIILDGNNFRW